jgi:hypothetical protein
MSFIPPPPGEPLTAQSQPPASYSLRTVALRQRAIILCILFSILILIVQLGIGFLVVDRFSPLTSTQAPGIGLFILLWVVVLAGWAIRIVSAVFVFQLAIAIYGTGIGVTLGILTLIPYLGLIPLLMVNGKATGILRAGGIHVGLMGANRDQIPPA